MGSSYREELNKWLSELDIKADKLLDIGGSQVSLKPRVQSWDVKELLIADLPDPHEDSPKPDVELDLNIKQNTYPVVDMIFCLEVFDYIYDPMTAMQNISNMLTKGGTAWVSFPSFYPLHQPVGDDALRYMPAGIVKLAESAGLSVEQMIKRRPETNLFESFFRAERMRAAKHEDHNFTGFICEFKK